jgi:site-specific DNA recombinase
MMLNLLASFAQLEREQDSDRVVMSHKHLAKDCKYLGGHIPLGYCVDENKYYQLDPVRSEIARYVFDLYLIRAGYTAILDFLNDPEVFPLTGKKRSYQKQDVYYMLHNEFYAGVYTRKIGADPRHRVTAPETIRIPGGVPAIVSSDEWKRICEISSSNANGYSASYKSGTVHPLSGLVHCGTCGSLMKLRHGGKTRSGIVERYYSCPNRCVKSARLEAVEKSVFSALTYLATDIESVRRAVDISNSFIDEDELENRRSVRPLEDRLQEIAKQKARLVSYIKNHNQAPASMNDELLALESEEKVLRVKVDSLLRTYSRYDAEQIFQRLYSARDIGKLPPDEQRVRVQEAVSQVIVLQDYYDIRLLCPTYSGDDPSHYVEHRIPR